MNNGYVATQIVADSDISLKAKGLYAYLAARAEKDSKCHVGVREIRSDLHIGNTQYYNCLDELKEKGVLRVIQSRTSDNKRLGVNVFYIMDGRKM